MADQTILHSLSIQDSPAENNSASPSEPVLSRNAAKKEEKAARRKEAKAKAAEAKAIAAAARAAACPKNDEEGSKSVPIHTDDGIEGIEGVIPQIEVEHVQNVYDEIAPQWHGTRYKPWPRVEAFVRAQPKGSLFGDMGTGNGKNLPACAESFSLPIACDVSLELAKIVAQRGFEVSTADIAALPFRSGVYDAVLCIAVLHHLSTRARRVAACSECCRVLRPGGAALFYAWAREQERGSAAEDDAGFSGHRFASQDVLVPFHVQVKRESRPKGAENAAAPAPIAPTPTAPVPNGAYDESKHSKVFQRYCHVYCRGELEGLFETLVVSGDVAIEESYYDTGNWCVIVRKMT